ncbi:hypothetical protein F443_22649 [Phytophthora nicotianae P1569]|uniref:Uncharacterized protein n=1 Tax=Phytophthora nicotianae P1569 TaxID=1317065 RepID=V9DW37_PHYNI|nr:hypothetical protein F443_22649 [Phytophthora nicotianae P1569]
MRSRHFLTTKCLDAPSVSAWMIMYKYGNDVNFLNATSLSSVQQAHAEVQQGLLHSATYCTRPPIQATASSPGARAPTFLMRGLYGTDDAVPCVWYRPSTLSRSQRRAERARPF